MRREFGNYPVVSQDVEDVAQEHEGAGGQAVQVLGVGHLQRLPQKSPGKNGEKSGCDTSLQLGEFPKYPGLSPGFIKCQELG